MRLGQIALLSLVAALVLPAAPALADLAPDLQHPVERATIAELWAKFPQDEVDLTPTPLSS